MSSDFKRILDNLKEKFVRLNDYIGKNFKDCLYIHLLTPFDNIISC